MATPSDHLTFLTTGTVKIKTAMRSQPISHQNVLLRRLRSFFSQQWTDSLPVGVFIVHHPGGPILFDTGQSPLCNAAGYFPRWNFAVRALTEFTIEPEDAVLVQLRAKLGIDPKDLQAIVLSHLHNDHAGGLKELVEAAPDVPIYVSSEHWEAFGKSPFHAAMEGCVPDSWPNPFRPRILEARDSSATELPSSSSPPPPPPPWKKFYSLTDDGKVIAVDTPGHVPGHVSLIVYADDGTTYFLPGDATYGIDLLDIEEPDGINLDPLRALESLRMIKEFARQTDVVVLPSHDPDTPRLLKERVVYKPK